MVRHTNTSASIKVVPATEMPSLTLTSLSSGPKCFPHGWCESSSVDDLSSCQEDLAMPGADEQEEEPHDPEVGEEDRDQRVEQNATRSAIRSHESETSPYSSSQEPLLHSLPTSKNATAILTQRSIQDGD